MFLRLQSSNLNTKHLYIIIIREELLWGFCIMYIKHMVPVSHDVQGLSCEIDYDAQYHVLYEPMPPFPQIISLQQK